MSEHQFILRVLAQGEDMEKRYDWLGAIDYYVEAQTALLKHPSQEVRAVLDLFDGEISIYKKTTERGLEKILKVEKMTHRKYAEDELPLGKG